MRDKKYCIGCEQDYYNHDNPQGVKECWHFKTAKAIERYRIGWWVPQDKVENFSRILTHQCHTETGRFAYYNELPSHLRT